MSGSENVFLGFSFLCNLLYIFMVFLDFQGFSMLKKNQIFFKVLLSSLDLTHLKEQVVFKKIIWRISTFNQTFESNLATIPVEPGFLWDFGLLSLKTCSLYHDKLFIQKFKVISSQVLNNLTCIMQLCKVPQKSRLNRNSS